MRESRTVFAGIALLIILRLVFFREGEMLFAGSVLILLAGTMVWFSDFWSDYLLTWGFMAYFASDFKAPQNSSAAVAMLGWVILLFLGVSVFFLV